MTELIIAPAYLHEKSTPQKNLPAVINRIGTRGDMTCIGTPRLQRSERSRAAILDFAYQLFINQGYAATAMRQIAKNTGLALSGIYIYNHFLSKEAVFQAILTERHPLLHLGTSLNPGEINRETAQTMLNEFDQYPEFFNLILIEIVEFKGKHLPELFESCTHDIPPPGIWHAFLSMFVSYQITHILFASTMPPGTQQISPDAFIDIFLHGISKSE